MARPWLVMLALVAAAGCGKTDAGTGASDDGGGSDGLEDLGACEGLFGRPGPSTGLDETRCSTTCQCEHGSWQAPVYDEAAIAALEARVLLDPPAVLEIDPYSAPGEQEQHEGVCAVVPDADDPLAYRLETFPSAAHATMDGGVVTHHGACGACSSLHDLAVYIRHDDLTTPVRACGILGLSEGDEANLECLLDLGFTPACAQIWFYNTVNTRNACFSICFGTLDDPYNLEDGSLNPCLQCDEEESGPVFKAVAGRTRRNSGLPSAICRPCDTVTRMVHEVP
jgi:hypothetical protein